MAVNDWSQTAASNTSVGGVSIAEGWSPDAVNNAIRGLMAEIAAWRDGDIASLGDSTDYQVQDNTLDALAALNVVNDRGIYATATDTFALYVLTSFGRTLGGLENASELRDLIGAVTVDSSSLNGTGYLKLNIAGTVFGIHWGTASASADGTTTISLPTTYSSFSRTVCSGARQNTNAQDNDAGVVTNGLSSFTVYSASGQSQTITYIGVGK